MQKGSLRTAIEDFFASFQVGERIKTAVTEYIDFLEAEALELNKDLAKELGIEKSLPDALSSDKGAVLKKKKPVILVAAAGMILGQVIGIVAGALRPIARGIEQDANISNPNEIPGLELLVQMFRTNPAIATSVITMAKKHGIDERLFREIENATENRVPFGGVVQLWLRGEIDERQLENELGKQGWDFSHIDHLKTLSRVIPPISDLIPMAVRDAFNETAARRFGYDEDFPTTILEFTRSQGLSDDWVRRYWRAHWQLPSPQQAFEMYQRLRPGSSDVPFTFADLQQYLVTADIPQFFRERLTEIAYNPITRVDARRMYGTGVYDERRVYESYLNIGLSPTNAEDLTQFTIRFEGGAEKELSRTAIIAAFKRGMFDTAETREQLLNILGSNELADFYMEMALFDLASEEQDAIIDNLKIRYVEGMIDRPETVSRLGQLNLPTTQQNTLLLKWDVLRENKIAIPSKSDYENWYKKGVANVSEVEAGLRERGIREPDIRRYINEFDREIQTEAQKELERAQKEAERTAQSDSASAYQSAIAIKDVEIAEARVEIANIKAALLQLPEDTDPIDLKQAILDIEVEIAEITLEKAEIKRNRR